MVITLLGIYKDQRNSSSPSQRGLTDLSHSLTMFPKTLAIAALVSIPASLAQLVICNDAGTVGSCNQFITTFCTSISTVPIAGGDSASRCFTGPGTAGLKCDFTAVNTQNETTHIDLNNCEAALTAAGNQCPLGGSGQFSNGTAVFKYFNDPNTGACAPPCGN